MSRILLIQHLILLSKETLYFRFNNEIIPLEYIDFLLPVVNLGKLENRAMKHRNGFEFGLLQCHPDVATVDYGVFKTSKRKNMLHAPLTVMEIYYLAATLNLLEQFGTVQHAFCRKSATISATDASSLAE